MVHEISDRLRQNDQMAVEDLLMRAGELAHAYQRLAEQDLVRREFFTTVAHELRTPLMTANGYLQLLQKGRGREEQLAGVIDTIARRKSNRDAGERYSLFTGDRVRSPGVSGCRCQTRLLTV